MKIAPNCVLLIYPFGNSDLAFNGETTFPRGENFRDHLDILRELLSDVKPLQIEGEGLPSGLDFSNCSAEQRMVRRGQQDFIIETVRFPILFEVLRGLFEEMRQSDQYSCELHFQPIVSDQTPSQYQDTIGIIPLLTAYVRLFNQCTISPCVRLLGPWRLNVNVSVYDELVPLYSAFYDQMHENLGSFSQVYCSLTTGTPQMSVAAGLVFASDPRIQFIYKPRGSDHIVKVNTFRKRVQEETLKRLGHLLCRFDFIGVLEALQSPRSGFMPQEARDSELLLKTLSA